MFVVSAGMQKSGSTLLMTYAAALVRRRYSDAGQRAFEEWIKHGPVGGSVWFAWDGWSSHCDELEALAQHHGPFVLKTHSSFTPLRDTLRHRKVKVIYSFRDPRDAILSALDHGTRSRNNADWPYAECRDIATTLPIVREWCKAAVTWLDAPDVLIFRYEELVEKPGAQVQRLAAYLGISDSEALAADVVAEERGQRQPGKNQFNKGLAGRWPAEMSKVDLAMCEEALGEYIEALGYKKYMKCGGRS